MRLVQPRCRNLPEGLLAGMGSVRFGTDAELGTRDHEMKSVSPARDEPIDELLKRRRVEESREEKEVSRETDRLRGAQGQSNAPWRKYRGEAALVVDPHCRPLVPAGCGSVARVVRFHIGLALGELVEDKEEVRRFVERFDPG